MAAIVDKMTLMYRPQMGTRLKYIPKSYVQRELFLSEVNNRETIVSIETINDTYFLQKQIEKFPLTQKCSIYGIGRQTGRQSRHFEKPLLCIDTKWLVQRHNVYVDF